ncbi:MAG: type II toxin-antitoxin system HicB family antitoxin [Deltaproteobacteria bacterium]|nr:type II toxin-antitoxin system HicB family antitoxin [Deltaproteobacteria bacterium]
MNRFLMIVEKAGQNYSAYSPDIPGCVATGATREEAEKNMHEAILLHIQGLKEEHQPIPECNSFAEYIIIAA